LFFRTAHNALKILVVGEAFVDIFPQENRIGGAPLNFAVHCAGLGASVVFATRVGDDSFGREIIDLLKTWKINTEMMQVDSRIQTGRVRVSVDKRGEPSFLIEGESAHDYFKWDERKLICTNPPCDLLYLGTMGSRHPIAQKAIEQTIEALPAHTKIFFDVNLRGKFYSKDLIERFFYLAHFVKLNARELTCVQTLLGFNLPRVDALKKLADQYHIEHICLTQEAQGGVSLYQDQIFRYDAVPCKNLVNSMGAGDAFSAMLATGLLQGWKLENTLQQAAALAAAICEETGAIPTDKNFCRNEPG
jgi:fructokinase